MDIKPYARFVYGFFGAVFLIGGISVLLLHTGLLPGAIKNIVVDVGHGDPNTLHIIQEFGSLLVFAGLISFWFARHYERSKTFHWAITTFWALFAVAHWVDDRGFVPSSRGLINTIPFILFLVIGLLRARVQEMNS